MLTPKPIDIWRAYRDALVRKRKGSPDGHHLQNSSKVDPQVTQVAQIYGKAKLPRGESELNPCLPSRPHQHAVPDLRPSSVIVICVCVARGLGFVFICLFGDALASAFSVVVPFI